MQVLDELTLPIGLKEAHLQLQLEGVALDPKLELVERDRPVVLGLAPPERVEVHAVKHLDAVLHGDRRADGAGLRIIPRSRARRSRARSPRRGLPRPPPAARAPAPRGTPAARTAPPRRSASCPARSPPARTRYRSPDRAPSAGPAERAAPPPRRGAHRPRRGEAPPRAPGRPPRRGDSAGNRR